MKITETKTVRLIIGDIETLSSYILLSFYNPDTNEWFEFEIKEDVNDLYKFISFYNNVDWEYVVGYNYVGFDAIIINYIFKNYKNWKDLKNLEIVEIIYKKVQLHIDNQRLGAIPENVYDYQVYPIDVFTILGLNNLARSSSLKKVEFQLDMENVEEMPIHHSTQNITNKECEEIKSYCRNDVLATYTIFKLVLGDTEHPLYKGNNQLSLRFDIREEFKIDCLNYSDIKIGDEIMKKTYTDAKNISATDLPKKGTFRKNIDLSKCIPKKIKFKTSVLQKLLKEIKNKKLIIDEKWNKEIKIGNTIYSQLLGGLHSQNNNEIWEANDDYLLHDDDGSSYYPKLIVENGYYPFHLGKELLTSYAKLYNRRVELKPLAKKDKKIKGIVDALKLTCNSIFGRMGSIESWLYDLQALYSVTLTGQFYLLKLIEEFELNGIKVISANSDGVTTYFHKDKLDLKNKIVKEWQELTNIEIETVSFKKFYYSTVNDYIAITKDGTVKAKGDFLKDFELYKNKSWKIVPMALHEYFVNDKNPIEFINNHKNIFDFCLMTRATGQLHLEEEVTKDGNIETIKHKKLIRYYLCKDSGCELFKRGIGSTGKDTNISLHANNELGKIEIKYFNKYEKKDFDNYNVDKRQYVMKCLKIIDGIEKTNKNKSYIESQKPQKQLSLF